MSFITWYQVVIDEDKPAGGLLAAAASALGLGLPLKVSNDLFSGSFILDADIKLSMSEGAAADRFEVTLIDLPSDTVEKLQAKQGEGAKKKPPAPLRVKVHLGYFDEPATKSGSQPVMEGYVTSIKSTVSEDGKLVTVFSGQETGGYRLRTTCEAKGSKGKTQVEELVKSIAKNAGIEPPSSLGLNVTLENFTLMADNGLGALRQIADVVKSPLVIRDNKILMGKKVGSEDAPIAFNPEKNLIKFDRIQENEETPEPCAKRTEHKVDTKTRVTFKALVLGHPKLRVGQKVKVEKKGAPKGTLRISQLEHAFLRQGGYTCDVTLVAAEPGEPAKSAGGVRGVVDRIQDLTLAPQSERPAIDLGQIAEYESGDQQKHLATLNYGQSPPAEAVAPSVEVEIDTQTQLHSKPFISPFAWHKCGLVVPVYPKMRAVLAHNRGLVNDALVAGFVWSENPRHEPPKNEPGDYWLCLPTQLGGDDLPTGKGVNDLIDKAGRRVLQAKGLKIVVGSEKLPEVGIRPTVPDDLDGQLTIEHKSGTTITITSDGAVKIETKSQNIELTNGGVTLKLNKTAVEVS